MILLGARALRQRRFSLVQAQDPCFTGLAALTLGKLFRLPIVGCVYGPNVYDRHWRRNHWTHRLLAPLGRFVLRRARSIQVDGRLTAQSLLAAGHPPEQIETKPVVPGNLDQFLAIRRTENSSAAPPKILYAGRLARQKKLALLLGAAQRLRASGRRFKLVIVGDGPEEKVLRRLAEEYALGDCVCFHGTATRAQMVQVFSEADVFAMSSDYEGFARVLMEAAAAALPIVTTAVSGSDEAVVDGVSGYIVPVAELEPLVEKLDLLIADRELRSHMGQAGRRHIAERLDPATNTPRQLAIWRKAAS
jgi:glycosyltransferase involved in cell wall biosynthesis